MPDIQKLNETKNRILSVVNSQGPSFPARIARETNISPLFVSAILSELVAEKKLSMSHMKVGSSPIYILPGQEKDLEKFSTYLNHKEREAFDLLKSKTVINDEQQDPAIRVALRKIKDFAIPVTVKNNEHEYLFWKYFLMDDKGTEEKIESMLNIKPTAPAKEPEKEPIREEIKKVIERVEIEEKPVPKTEKVSKKAVKKESLFGTKLKDYLSGRDIELLQEINAKPKELNAKVRIDTPFGKQEFYLIAKDKKKITEEELIIAVQRAQTEKMPALIMSPGEPDKLAKEYLKEWRNLIKFESIKL